jgi:hypothetical protein
MQRLSQVALSALVLMFSVLPVSAAEQEVSLSHVAAISHLTYTWLGAERAVTLSGPGLVLLVRPGESLYEVNDRVESASAPARYAGNDIYVPASLAAHIEQLARHAQLLSTSVLTEQQVFERASSSTAATVHGSITLDVHPLQGAAALLVTGSAPPSAPVMLTLLAQFSSDLPNVVISRHDIQTEPDGRFQAIVPTGPDYTPDSFLRVIATSVPGVEEATAQVTIGSPNAGLLVPWERQPGGIW